ncbi:hypothetical protein IU501_12445 [Nocardia otitidiscaviarum]|uniref:hypothetical protein n=1 Tax=Nocardia otitidiscaviarum TaxID=1823 RepID=UPI0011DD0814|nr:hypothetical protein [Nocardia otitidiscaviarum]MBF6133807.1 hypothetical protein [Nocardia otitidiscaviarum]MBF6487835.1 hypothetical protein [Nocardia otitidiscaviarum]
MSLAALQVLLVMYSLLAILHVGFVCIARPSHRNGHMNATKWTAAAIISRVQAERATYDDGPTPSPSSKLAHARVDGEGSR